MTYMKVFLLKFVGLIISTPLLGYGALLIIENIEAAWKSNNRKKKWFALSMAMFALAILLGWLQ